MGCFGSSRALGCALAGMLALGACVGELGGGNAPGASTCEVTPERVGLQRLTRAEYNRTVRDLFGVTSAPADLFPPDSATSGFDNNAKSLTISPQLAKLLLDAAETVAAEAMVQQQDEIISCDPADGDACARQILTELALRVYRRPASDAEIDDLMRFVAFAEDEGDSFELAIEYALTAMLMAPQFLYRGVPVAAPDASKVVPLDDYALASRLSYFLWGSTPDDALLARASEGLREPGVLRAELDRMLADPKSEALYDSFVMQWLQLGKLESATPDAAAFPMFDETLRQAMLEETRLFFQDLVARDGSALEIINGTQTFASGALADIYGVTGGDPVSLDPAQRAGMLTMPAILTMTSGPLQPNIVKRGVWLAEAILCAKPPPPPEGVPAEPAPIPGETERERLARHRADPSCASCHNLIDPLGFAFESYDAIGRRRDDIDGAPVDDEGSLPDGTTFNGVVELSEVLASEGQYGECMSDKLMTYALGRTVNSEEACVLTQIAAEHVTPESKLSDLLWAIVSSDAFQSERVEEVSP